MGNGAGCPTDLLQRAALEIFSEQTFNLTIAVVTGAICCLDYCSFPFTLL